MPKPPPLAATPSRRQHVRVELLAQVEWRKGTEVQILEVSNASLGGLFLQGPREELESLRRDAIMELALFNANEHGGAPISMRAKVVRIDWGELGGHVRFGVQIIEIKPQALERYKSILNRAT
jgi:hypothetical protein